MTLKKYTISVTEAQYWDEIHNVLVEDSNEDGIPDRQVTCSDYKEHSPTRGTFLLHANEAKEISNHPHVKWIELDPSEYPEEYPSPSLNEPLRWGSDIKVYRDLSFPYTPVSTGATVGELNRTVWSVVRAGIRTSGDFWAGTVGGIPPKQGNVYYTATGKHVDIVVHDSGVLASHPEFLDENGMSRVRDIVLDGPFYIDPDYFITNNLTYTRWDGRVGCTTAAARDWWMISSSRSVGFSTIGLVSISTGYQALASIGVGSDGTSSLTSGHGTSAASLIAGKNFGLAFEANIWNMSGIGNPSSLGITIERNYDLIKLFHLYKPVNPETGVKNPTLVNGSWGYNAAFSSSDTVSYRFKGTTGTFIGTDAAVANTVTAMKEGIYGTSYFGTYKSWSSSSRSSATDTAGSEMMDSGVIYVAAAGNNNQYLGIGSTDPHRLNYMSDVYFGTTDPRPEFPSGTVPCNHRDWMNPQGIGFNSTTDPEFHPVICVGALEEYIMNGTEGFGSYGAEYQAAYSNNGPGIDIWSAADETLAAGLPSGSYADYQRYDDTRHYDNNFNGTSAAAPTASGVIAIYLQTNRQATSRDVKNWIRKHGSQYLGTELLADTGDVYDEITDIGWWTNYYNLRGAEPRIIFNPFVNDKNPKIDGVTLEGVDIKII